MSTQAQERETVVVTGQVTGVLAKGNDKWQIVVMPQGSQYVKNLWTKDYGLVSQMEQNINSWYSFVCGVSPWTNNQGQPVKSLWINQVTAPGQAAAPQPTTPQQPAQGQPQAFPQGEPGISPLEKEERIMREHAMGVVALMLPHMQPSERNAAGMVSVAEGLIAYYKLGPSAVNGQRRSPDAPGYGDEPDAFPEAPGEELPPDPDDGIPF